MATDLDVAKMMWGWGDHPGGTTATGASSRSQTSVRYGTVTAVHDDGTVSVRLDGTGEVVTLTTDTPLAVGDRVTIVVQGGAYMVYAMSETVAIIDRTKGDLAQQIKDEGDRILDEVNGEMDEFKASHQLTDDDITSSIEQTKSELTAAFEGQIQAAEDGIEKTYATKTELSVGIDGLRSEVSETYATSAGVENQISSAIEQASGEISQTVEQNVVDSIGDTFATKTELTQTSSDLTISINQAITKAEGAASEASDALSTAREVESYFTFDSTGLTVGRTGESAAVKMASDGSFQVLNSGEQMLKVDSYDGNSRIQAPLFGKVAIWTEASSVAYFSREGYSFSSEQLGFRLNDLSAVETCSFTPSSQTGTTTITKAYFPTNMSYVVVHYVCVFDNSSRSVKVPLTKGSSVGADLIALCYGGDNLISIVENIILTYSGTTTVRITITRGKAQRASVRDGSCNFNASPGTQFYITKVNICS